MLSLPSSKQYTLLFSSTSLFPPLMKLSLKKKKRLYIYNYDYFQQIKS